MLKNKKDASDCELLMDNVENTLQDLGNCFEDAFDGKKTKMNVLGGIFKFTKSLTKLTLNTTGCVIKNTPKAVVAVAAVKKDLVTAIEEGMHEHQKQMKENALNEKIAQLKLKR